MKNKILALCLGLSLVCGCAAAPIVAVGGIGALAGYEMGKEKRNCPYCDEQIPRKATVCKYCGNKVEPVVTQKEKEQSPNDGEQGYINDLK